VPSDAVAAALLTLVDIGTLGKGARTTAEFVERFNQMFDCFNSSTLSSATPYKGAFQDGHLEFLKDCESWLTKVQCANGNRELPCLLGWRHNISAMQMLWKDMKGIMKTLNCCDIKPLTVSTCLFSPIAFQMYNIFLQDLEQISSSRGIFSKTVWSTSLL